MAVTFTDFSFRMVIHVENHVYFTTGLIFKYFFFFFGRLKNKSDKMDEDKKL